MRLTEDQIRAKVIELYDRCDQRRMDLWLFSGIRAGVIDADIAEKVMNEEIHRRSKLVREFWLGPCLQPCCARGMWN